MVEAWNIKVHGRVQGVGYRFSAQRQAQRLRLSGWVRNNYDHSVQVFVQGESGNVALFLKWLAQGPPMAHVTDIEQSPASFDSRCTLFDITF